MFVSLHERSLSEFSLSLGEPAPCDDSLKLKLNNVLKETFRTHRNLLLLFLSESHMFRLIHLA